jgi:hypothetical protein
MQCNGTNERKGNERQYITARIVLFLARSHIRSLLHFRIAREYVVAAGQVIRRLQFTWRGTPSPTTAASARAFAIVLYITIFHWFTIAVLYVTSLALNPNDYSKPEPITGWEKPTGTLLVVMVLFDIFKYMYYGITVWLLYNLRVSVRAKYAIPGNEGDDCCCSFWCPCLVAGQLLRHTTDYDVYPSQLCTDTGLPARTPMIV